MKKFLVVMLVTFISLCFVNAQTDLLSDFSRYAPSFAEKHPQIIEKISAVSEGLSSITDQIPSPSEWFSNFRRDELPLDPADIAHNAYIEDSPLLTFYPKENVGVLMKDEDSVSVFGITHSKEKSHLIVCVNTVYGETLSQTSLTTDGNNEFHKTVSVPDTDETQLEIAVYTGSKAYGEFQSWVLNYVYLSKDENGSWSLAESPVYENNKSLYEKDKSTSEALKSTPSIPAEGIGVASVAQQITADLTTDYEKLLAIHDWVASYLYYDVDSLSAEQIPPYAAEEVLKRRRAVCLGYANLVAALCRNVGIPCNVVSGYALGVGEDTAWIPETVITMEQNHAWNEAYVDGRWVILDATWDSPNKYENGKEKKGGAPSHLYFDANLQFFSSNHKIIEYMKKR